MTLQRHLRSMIFTRHFKASMRLPISDQQYIRDRQTDGQTDDNHDNSSTVI